MMKRFVIALAIAIASVGCSTRVQPGYVGVKVNWSGTDKGVQGLPVVTGRVWYNPYSEQVIEYPTFVQNVSLTANVNEGHPVNEEITFTNKDQMRIAADISFAYHLDPTKVPDFYVKFRSDDLDQFTHGYMRSLIRDKFNEIAGRYAIEQIMGDNGSFVKEVKEAVQKDIAPYGVVLEPQFGIIGSPRPPDQVIANINAKVAAVQLAQQTENELRTTEAQAKKAVAQAEGAARSQVAEAQGQAEAVLTIAKGQAEANRRLAESITPSLLELKRLEKWDGSLPYVNGGSTNPFISLERKQ
jgi:regulator of protease activity HflC (stomatin/prohibitin superfamily)